MNDATIYCLCLNEKNLSVVKKLGYEPVGLGNGSFSSEWVRDNTLNNISSKNRYYGEYTFHYWFWKNILPKISDNKWVGFCAHRDFWSNKSDLKGNKNFKVNKENIPNIILNNDINFGNHVLRQIPEEWNSFDTVIGKHMYINNLQFSKLIKHGLRSLFRNPQALFKSKRNIRFHFDMWHGNGNLDKAIDVLDNKDRDDFRNYTRQNISFSRGNMFVCRSKKIINDYYSSIFPWLERCEKIFGFNLDGYGKTRIYAFLAERYLSYWFSKYTKPLLWPVIFYDINK
jgi:hypothetical protein